MKNIPLEKISVRGELRTRLLKNFARMHDKMYRSGYAGLPPYRCEGWPGDWEGRAMLALTLDAEALGEPAPTLEPLYRWIQSILNDEGYRSEPNDKLNLEDINEQMHSAQNWLLRALFENYRIHGDEQYLEMAKQILRKLYLPIKDHLKNYPKTAEDRANSSDNAVVGHTGGHFKEWRLSSDIGCIFMSFDALGQAWGIIEEEPLKSQIGELIDEMLAAFRHVDYVGSRLQTHATLTCMRGIMRVYRIKRDPALLQTIIKYFDDFEHYGMTANYGNANCFRTIGHTEPCGAIDSFMLCYQLWEETGDRHYLETAYKIWYNSVLRGQRENGGMGCDTTVDDGKVHVFADFYEAYHCCSMRGAEGLGYPVRSCVYEENDTLTLPFYFDFCATLSGDEKIAFTSLYPEIGDLTLKVTAGTGRKIDLKLYIPSTATDLRFAVNGEAISAAVGADGFVHIPLTLSAGTELRVTFLSVLHKVPCERYWHTGKNEYTLEYGDLVLGCVDDFDGELDCKKLHDEGNARFSGYGHVFEPLHLCYLMTRDETMSKAFQVVFR